MNNKERDHNQPLYQRVYAVVKQIPLGKVATYGQIAKIVAGPAQTVTCTPSMVGYAMAALPFESDVPWQRVINSQGKVSARSSTQHVNVQQQILEREGIVFSESGKVDFAQVRWEGPDVGWLLEHGFEFEQGLFGPML